MFRQPQRGQSRNLRRHSTVLATRDHTLPWHEKGQVQFAIQRPHSPNAPP
jgi:hypothetical protein